MVSIIGNIVLSVFKLIAGIIAHSNAMISDSVHSFSDVFSSIIVIIGVRVSSKESDRDHPYGHERLECVAAIVLSTILFATGLGIGYMAVSNIITRTYANSVIPGGLALIAALFSIVIKESMFWYTHHYAKSFNSSALMADAWHHRSDALSSIGSFIGIICARSGYPVMDTIASFIICLFICKAAYDIFKDAIDKMVDKSCDLETENNIRNLVIKQPGVIDIDLLNTRMFGNKIYVDLEISANGELTLRESHAIAENIHKLLEYTYPELKHIMVHVNPFDQ